MRKTLRSALRTGCIVFALLSWHSILFAKDIIATYDGTFPGADCSGLRTTIVLYKGCCGAMGTYDQKETYIATRDGDKTFYSKGKWMFVKGTKKNKDAVVLQMDYNKPGKSVNYLVVNDKKIELLDKDMNEIKTPVDLSLKKK